MKKGQKYVQIMVLVCVLAVSIVYAPGMEVVEGSIIPGAHRGSSVNHIENSTTAIQEAAYDAKYEFIEFDVQYTKDKKIVLFHDLSLERLQDSEHEIGELTHLELQDISQFDIPLYKDVMDLIGTSKKINIEIKSQGILEDDIELVNFVMQDITERGITKNIILSSISKDVVRYISTVYPKMPVGKIYWIKPFTYFPTPTMMQDFYAGIEEMGADYVMLHGINLRIYDVLQHYKPANVQLCFWYFDDRMFIVE
jgi:glycerophosphoryl diester phosphodiesterase